MANLLLSFYGPSRDHSLHRIIHDTIVGAQVEFIDPEAESHALDEWLEAVCSDLELRNLTETHCKVRENEFSKKMDFYREEIKQYHSHLISRRSNLDHSTLVRKF